VWKHINQEGLSRLSQPTQDSHEHDHVDNESKRKVGVRGDNGSEQRALEVERPHCRKHQQ
jgi:hypothetical protein